MRADRDRVPEVASWLGLPSIPAEWSGVDALLPILERMKGEGAVVLLKLDGERGVGDNGAYTAVVSGAPLAGDFLRIDAETLEDALAHVIVRYAARRWGYEGP